MATCQSCFKRIPEEAPHCPHCGTARQSQASESKKTVFGYAPNPAVQPPPPSAAPSAEKPMPPPTPQHAGSGNGDMTVPEPPPSHHEFWTGELKRCPSIAIQLQPTNEPAAFDQDAPTPLVPTPGPLEVQPTAETLLSKSSDKIPAFGRKNQAAVAPVQPVPRNLYLLLILGGMLAARVFAALVLALGLPQLMFLSWIPALVSTVFFAMLIYKAWEAIQDAEAPVSPVKATGFLFIPFFNFYWAFVAFGGWPSAYNAFAERHGLKVATIDPRLFVAYAILFVALFLASFIPVVNQLAFVAFVVFTVLVLIKLCDGINALAQTTGSP